MKSVNSILYQKGGNLHTPLETGIKMEVPDDCMLQVMNKSGVASKKHLIAGACVVDEGYDGEIFVKQNDKDRKKANNISKHSYRDRNPQWISDTELLFVSDRDGHNEIYKSQSNNQTDHQSSKSNQLNSTRNQIISSTRPTRGIWLCTYRNLGQARPTLSRTRRRRVPLSWSLT